MSSIKLFLQFMNMSNIKTVSPEKVLTFCLSIINKYTKDEVEVAFDEVAPDIYFIQNKKPQTTFYKQSTHKRIVPVVYLKNGFLFHWGIAFKKIYSRMPKNGYIFKGVSMQFFNDNGLLFRAEWDNKELEENKLNHPQPHWHIEPTIMFNDKEIDKEVKETFDELSNETDFFHYMNESEKECSKIFNYEKFHFAMSAKWHENTTLCNIPLTEENLKKWLDKSLEGINEQLDYICK